MRKSLYSKLGSREEATEKAQGRKMFTTRMDKKGPTEAILKMSWWVKIWCLGFSNDRVSHSVKRWRRG